MVTKHAHAAPSPPSSAVPAQWWGIDCALTQKPFVVTDMMTNFTTRLAFPMFAAAWEYCFRAYGKGWQEWVTIRPLTTAEARQYNALLAASAAYKSVMGNAPDCAQDLVQEPPGASPPRVFWPRVLACALGVIIRSGGGR